MKTGNCRCEACGQMFYSMTAYESHRFGSFAQGRTHHSRRCLTHAEMRAKGMRRSPKGVWNSGQFQRRIEQAELWPMTAA
jgi:hypothetical protein